MSAATRLPAELQAAPLAAARDRQQPAAGGPLLTEPTFRLGTLVLLFSIGCLAALALGMPALAVTVAPLGPWILWGLLAERHASCEVSLLLERERAVEGETVQVTILVRDATAFQQVLCSLILPPGLLIEEAPSRVAVTPSRSGRGTTTLSVRCQRWGVYRVGPGAVLARNSWGIFQARGATSNAPELRVYPVTARLRRGIQPAMTQVFVGEETSRERTDGFEFADIRSYQPGDHARRINWTVTARHGEPYVNLYHPERNSDVILIVDSFADFGDGEEGTLKWEGRAVAALAEFHLARRDRVGLVCYGGVLHWLPPGSGSHHFYRILDNLIETAVVESYERPTLRLLPPRSLPPHALVVAFSPLLDHRMIDLLLDLQGRGCDLAVVEVNPEPFTPGRRDAGEALSGRIWRLSRSAQRQELWRAGLPLIRWDHSQPLDSVLVQLNQMRHGRWRVRA
jgi:uncharacterized protein (DUF58 family)